MCLSEKFARCLLSCFLSPDPDSGQPRGGILFVWVAFGIANFPAWTIIPIIGLMMVGLVVETLGQKRLVQRKFLPRRQELEQLRAKLLNGAS